MGMAAGRDYIRTGDPFTERVEQGEGPPCVHHYQNDSTGRDYFTRVCIHECQRLNAVTVAGQLRELAKVASDSEGRAVSVAEVVQGLSGYWTVSSGNVQLFTLRDVPELIPGQGVVFGLETTETGPRETRGVRVWLTCPRCRRRCGALYAAEYGPQGRTPRSYTTGCRACLGLTDASRQRHGCQDWATAARGERDYPEARRGWYQARTPRTEDRARDVHLRSLARMLRGDGWAGF